MAEHLYHGWTISVQEGETWLAFVFRPGARMPSTTVSAESEDAVLADAMSYIDGVAEVIPVEDRLPTA